MNKTTQAHREARDDRFNDTAATILRYTNSAAFARRHLAAYLLGIGAGDACHTWTELEELAEHYNTTGAIPTTLHGTIVNFADAEQQRAAR